MNHNKLRHLARTPAHWAADYLIAMLPIYFWSLYTFGAWQTHWQLSLSILSCFVFVLALSLACRQKVSLYRVLYAFVLGGLLGFAMPSAAPMWYSVLGAFLASLPPFLPYVGKMMRKHLHPIAFALTVLGILNAVDFLKTPLGNFLATREVQVDVYALLFGRHSGAIGEVSVLMLLISGAYLLLRKVIDYKAPLAMLLTLALLAYLFPMGATRLDNLLLHVCSGGAFFVAVFLMDAFAGRIHFQARIAYGVLTGILTYLLRLYISTFDAIYLALLISSAVILVSTLPTRYLSWKSEF